jgi:hypothetical protein
MATTSEVETFTPEQIAVIAADVDRVPSSNDLFVRYEDYSAALAAAGPKTYIEFPYAVSLTPVSGETLAAAGYRRFDQEGGRRSGEGGFVALWQKPVGSDGGTRYFINVTEYDFTSLTGKACDPSFQADVQFLLQDGNFSNVMHSVGRKSVEQIERYFSILWDLGCFVYVDLNVENASAFFEDEGDAE